MTIRKGSPMKIRSQWFYIFVVILLFSLTGCKSQEAPMEYGIVVQLDKAWWPRNLLEYPFTHWTYMFKPDGEKTIPPRRLGVTFSGYGAFSPDGKWFAYQDGWNDQIYVMKVSDGKKFRVSSGSEEMAVNVIKWLGDGHTIAYGEDKVYIQDIRCLLTKKTSSNCLPQPSIIELGVNTLEDISPDGKKIIYTREYEDYKFEMYLMDVDQPHPILLQDATGVTFINNTTVLATFSNDDVLYTAEIAANGLTNKKAIAVFEEGDGGFSLSPDGKYVAFSSIREEEGLGEEINPYGPVESHPSTSALFVMEVATGQIRRLTYPNDHDVVWYGWYPLR